MTDTTETMTFNNFSRAKPACVVTLISPGARRPMPVGGWKFPRFDGRLEKVLEAI
jgi:hypothetical protein